MIWFYFILMFFFCFGKDAALLRLCHYEITRLLRRFHFVPWASWSRHNRSRSTFAYLLRLCVVMLERLQMESREVNREHQTPQLDQLQHTRMRTSAVLVFTNRLITVSFWVMWDLSFFIICDFACLVPDLCDFDFGPKFFK